MVIGNLSNRRSAFLRLLHDIEPQWLVKNAETSLVGTNRGKERD